MRQVKVLEQNVDNVTKEELESQFSAYRFLIPVNIDVLMKLRRDQEFSDLVAKFRRDIRLVVDSQVICFSARLLLGETLQERVSGSDFLPFLCRKAVATPGKYRVFLLGGMDSAASDAMNRINRQYGAEVIVGALSPTFGFENKPAEIGRIVEAINTSGANVLAVGVGAPKQEKWIFAHADKMPGINLFMAVGATIDFEAGKVRRAPQWISNMGFEWLYRMIKEPRRLARRYLIEGTPFFWLLLKQRLGRL